MEDKAWAEFNTPLNEKALLNFCTDIEVLFRINPYLEVKYLEQISGTSYKLHAINYSQIPEFELKTEFRKTLSNNEIKLQYSSGIKSSTVFSINTAPKGSKLTIIENYSTDQSINVEENLHTVDKSLKKWAEEIQQFLIQWKRWKWFSPWRLYKLRIWLPMKPSARRVVDILVIISVIEVLLITIGTTLYVIFYK